MSKGVAHLKTGYKSSCIEISEKRIFVTGENLIKIFSMENFEEIENFASEDRNYEAVMTPDEKMVFIMSCNGLKQFSFPDMRLVKVIEHTSDFYVLDVVKSLNCVIFSHYQTLYRIDLDTFSLSELPDEHELDIISICFTPDEKTFFTTGKDTYLKKWETSSWTEVQSLEIQKIGNFGLVSRDSESLFVGFENGSLSQYSSKDLSHIRSIPLHIDSIEMIICLKSGELMTCSSDGYLKFPFTEKEPINLSDSVHLATQLSNGSIACSCENGIRILAPLPPEDPLDLWIDSISSSLKSIRSSSPSSKKSQLISLLRHHVSQLLDAFQPHVSDFTGLAVSLLPNFKSIQRSHVFKNTAEGKRKILTQNYSLQTLRLNPVAENCEALLILFDRKVKYFGRVVKPSDPLVGFKVKELRRGKWVFSLDEEIGLGSSSINSLATVRFRNGFLHCYTSEGILFAHPEFKATLNMNGAEKKVSAIGNDGMIVTSDSKIYWINFQTNTVRLQNQ